jgi:fumarate reductase flavoprotein subunit
MFPREQAAVSSPGANDFDVIVVGAGGAGLAAALAAAGQGARVLVAEAADRTGGATALSGGNVLAAGSAVQQAAGIDDSPDALFRHISAINRHRPRPGVVRRYCEAAPETIGWLASHGVVFDPADLRETGGAGPARAHRARGHGAGLVEVLEARALAAGVEFAFQTRVQALLRDRLGRVCGISHDGMDITAGSVVLATGGFGGNHALLREHYPAARRFEEQSWYIGPGHSQGDGLILAKGCGADLWGEGEGLLILTAGLSRDIEIYLPPWLVHVNRLGHRFVNEMADYVIQSRAVQDQPGGFCYSVFDESTRLAFAKGVVDPRTAFPSPNWTAQAMSEHVAAGRIVTAGTVEALAECLGLPPRALAGSLERYNAAARGLCDRDFEKPAQWMRVLETGPFHAVRLVPAVLSLTGTGPRIDEDGRVLADGGPLPGLFAAGEVTGGIGGALYAGNGASVGNALVFGRLAGLAAARAAR